MTVAFPDGRSPEQMLTDFVFGGKPLQASPLLDTGSDAAAEDYVFALTLGCPCCRLTGDPVAARFSAQPIPSDLEATSDERP